MIEELAVLGGPSNLHHSWRDDRHLVVPHAWIHAEGTANALEGRGVTSSLVTAAEKDQLYLQWGGGGGGVNCCHNAD